MSWLLLAGVVQATSEFTPPWFRPAVGQLAAVPCLTYSADYFGRKTADIEMKTADIKRILKQYVFDSLFNTGVVIEVASHVFLRSAKL
jgi:hypothetical protein